MEQTTRVLSADAQAELHRNGCYLARSVFEQGETEILLEEADALIAAAPTDVKAARDASGRTVIKPEDFAVKESDKGSSILSRVRFPMWRSRLFLEAYGNPIIHRMAFDLYRKSMVPFDESIVVKLPGHGAGFPWHQDGRFKTGAVAERGHNFGIYLTRSTPENGALLVIPGSHRQGILDFDSLVASNGFDLPGAVYATADPGDAQVHHRSLAHGSRTNESRELRVTWYVGFHHRDAVVPVWDDAAIQDRLNLIPIGVEARKRSGRYPKEEPFDYGLLGLTEPTDERTRARSLRAPGLQI